MMIQRRVLAAAAIALVSKGVSADRRSTARPYVANEIVTLRASPGIESAIAFGPDERIENIAVGNSATWDVNANKRANVVFVKPAKARARTNMTVITSDHIYLFDLVSASPSVSVYMMRFTYPDAPKPAPMVTPTAAKALADTSPPPKPKTLVPMLNYAWRASGEKRLLPASYFDDGASTFLRWQSEANLPAILVRGPNGSEGPINYTVQGDYIVVEGVPAQLILRSGRQVATLSPLARRPTAVAQTSTADPVAALTAERSEQ